MTSSPHLRRIKLKVTLSKEAGFCPGVRRADIEIKKLISAGNSKIYTLGHLIHNKGYNDSLSAMGVGCLTFPEVVPTLNSLCGEDMTLVIRTHGITCKENDFLIQLERENENFHETVLVYESYQRDCVRFCNGRR